MRSDVDLPHPDGPTKTMNSPSSISRSRLSTAAAVDPGYTRVAPLNEMVAMLIPTLHRQARAGRSVVKWTWSSSQTIAPMSARRRGGRFVDRGVDQRQHPRVDLA